MIKKQYDPIHNTYTITVDKSDLEKAFATKQDYVQFLLECYGFNFTVQDIMDLKDKDNEWWEVKEWLEEDA